MIRPTAHKIAPGLYSINTPFGPAEAHGVGREWFVTYPGQSRPDCVASSLTRARELVGMWVEEREAYEAAS